MIIHMHAKARSLCACKQAISHAWEINNSLCRLAQHPNHARTPTIYSLLINSQRDRTQRQVKPRNYYVSQKIKDEATQMISVGDLTKFSWKEMSFRALHGAQQVAASPTIWYFAASFMKICTHNQNRLKEQGLRLAPTTIATRLHTNFAIEHSKNKWSIECFIGSTEAAFRWSLLPFSC